MPVSFLSRDQTQQYGRFNTPPSPEQLARYFYLDETDREFIAPRRRDHNRLGVALQLGTLRFLGTFLPTPTDVPLSVVEYVAAQLDIAEPMACLPQYLERPRTYQAHAKEIQHFYGYRDFTDPTTQFQLMRWLYARAWLGTERPSVLFDLTTARLVEQKIILPGVSVLERFVARIRDRASARLWRALARLPSATQRQQLEELLLVPEGARVARLEQLRRAPTRVSAMGMVGALERLETIRALGVRGLNLARLPLVRVEVLARHAAGSWTQTIARMPEERRLATLLAFAFIWEGVAQDDALDLLDLFLSELWAKTQRKGQLNRLRTLGDLDQAALHLRDASQVILDPECPAGEVRDAIFDLIPPTTLAAAVETVTELARPPDARRYYEEVLTHYSSVRRFLPRLLNRITFAGIAAAKPLLEALDFLKQVEANPKLKMTEAPLEIVSYPWRRYVFVSKNKISRRAYTFCVLEHLHQALRRREVFVSPSERWGDPRAKLLQGDAWLAVRSQVCRTLDLSVNADEELRELERTLHEAYERTLANLPQNPALRVEQVEGQDRLMLEPLEKLEEPASLLKLRDRVADLLPQVELPEVLLEIQALTQFTDGFTHLSEGQARVKELELSLCAVLLAEACNIPLRPLIQPGSPALSASRLNWVQQNFLRVETLTQANARLVDYQLQVPLAQQWGGGEVASADGLRFVVPVRTINAAPNSKYYPAARGVTYFNFTSDQFTGFHGIVIPGTLRDSLFILAGLLEHQTRLQPTEVMTDSASYSDIVFGLFWLLGYQFSPRLTDLGDRRFWRIDPLADYGALDNLARHRINLRLIRQNWDDLLRVAGSLKLGTVSAPNLMRTLQRSNRPSVLARAIGELGRIVKTLYLLSYIDDESYRRRILTQLNRGEGRHSVARATFHGRRGELRQRYREGQEDQLGALGLVVNAIVLWNTRYMEAALAQLRQEGMLIRPEDVARLSPLLHEHINMLGRYHFVLEPAIAQGHLRPLRQFDPLED